MVVAAMILRNLDHDAEKNEGYCRRASGIQILFPSIHPIGKVKPNFSLLAADTMTLRSPVLKAKTSALVCHKV